MYQLDSRDPGYNVTADGTHAYAVAIGSLMTMNALCCRNFAQSKSIDRDREQPSASAIQ
jgi:hypothetical protein